MRVYSEIPYINSIHSVLILDRFKNVFTVAAKREHRFGTVHEAVKNGDFRELEMMVKAGASVNEVDTTKDRFTPIHWACHKGALEVGAITSRGLLRIY